MFHEVLTWPWAGGMGGMDHGEREVWITGMSVPDYCGNGSLQSVGWKKENEAAPFLLGASHPRRPVAVVRLWEGNAAHPVCPEPPEGDRGRNGDGSFSQ